MSMDGEPALAGIIRAAGPSRRSWHESSINRPMVRMGIFPAIYLLFFLMTPAHGDIQADMAQQRADFLAAERALERGTRAEFDRLSATLNDYPLYPYLKYTELRQRLNKATPDEVEQFLAAYADTPLAPRLRYQWLKKLADRGAWDRYLQFYHASNDATLQCHYRRALLAAQRPAEAFAHVEQLWLVAYSQPRACDPLFEAWNEAGGITRELVWQRIRLSMQARQIRLARYLAGLLPPEEQQWAKLWRQVDENPKLLLDRNLFTGVTNPYTHDVVAHGVKRLARLHPEEVLSAWHYIDKTFVLGSEERAEVESYVGISLAAAGRAEALSWLAVIPPELTGSDIREWRIRSALAQQNWDAVLAWIDRLPADEQHLPRWQYWRARALAQQGQQEVADEIYLELARLRHYYAFLAADRLEMPYEFQEQSLDFPPGELISIENIPGISRARELFILGRIVDARREWHHATRALDEPQQRRAAKLAQQWGWYDRAIFAMAATSHRDDLELRFPLAYQEQVLQQAALKNINPALAFAIIRQESAFTEDVRSPAGALGLMQLMPDTARFIARSANVRLRHTSELLNADLNIRLGITYLRRLLDRFDDHPVLATTAYNAGPYRVRGWVPVASSLPADLWVETLPFRETRGYVQNVFAYAPIYERRLGRKPSPLHERMPAIGAPPL